MKAIFSFIATLGASFCLAGLISMLIKHPDLGKWVTAIVLGVGCFLLFWHLIHDLMWPEERKLILPPKPDPKG